MKPKILLVDDDPLMHMPYRKPLEQAGYQVLTASRVDEATSKIAAEPPQVIVIDIYMPGTDGLTAVRNFKKSEQLKDIPILVVTASNGARSK